MSERYVVIPELDDAYLYDNSLAQTRAALRELPIGVLVNLACNIRGGDLIIERAVPTQVELDIMARSIQEQREYGIVQVRDAIKIIKGEAMGTDPDEVAGALGQLGARTVPGMFSHTHWNQEFNPLPSFGGMGLGDVPFWDVFRQTYPGLECRVVAAIDEDVVAMRYHGHITSTSSADADTY